MTSENKVKKTFKDLGLCEELCEACDKMKWTEPTPIQVEAIPIALAGNDVVGLAETGSGKTAAFGLPMLNQLLANPQPYFGVILTPTRELAVQIKEQMEALGEDIGLQCCAVIGNMDVMEQGKMVMMKPHVIIATLGRLAHLVKELRGFSSLLSSMKYLIMDEADRILSNDFEDELDIVIRALPKKRTTMLFSATITNKVQELQRAHLKNAVKVQINSSFKIVDTLKQYVLAVPFVEKHIYLLYLLRERINNSVIVFCNTRTNTVKTALILRQCGLKAVPLYGDMSQEKRLSALKNFKSQERSALVATDVASRGLDIPCVDFVINFEVPNKSEDYIHRVGRTARAGRKGVAITMTSQYEVEDFLRIEQLIVKNCKLDKMEAYPVLPVDVKPLEDIVNNAEKEAKKEQRRLEDMKKYRESDDEDGEDGEGTIRKRIKKARKEHPQTANKGGKKKNRRK